MSYSLTQKQRFCCSLCSYTTTRKYNLERHTGTVHIPVAPKDIPFAPKDIPVAPKDIPNLACDHCSQTFASKYSLQRHINRGCKGYIVSNHCPHCGQAFTLACNKYRHIRKCLPNSVLIDQQSQSSLIYHKGIKFLKIQQ